MKHPDELISSYLDGELSGTELQGLLRHLGECGRCSSEIESIQAVRSAVRSLPVLEMPDGLMPDLDGVVVPLHRNRGVWMGAAAAVVAAVIAIATLFTPAPPSVSVEDLNSRFAARVSLDPAFGPAKVIVPDVGQVRE